MTPQTPLDPHKKLDIEAILEDLESYQPTRKGWIWRKVPAEGVDMGPFHFHDMSEPLKNSLGLPASKYFDHIDPQPSCVITSEIASGRFEDDLRRMRMAAWNGADHLMVIRTAGQSHFDGLIEGTPEGTGGVPITRKQIRATRKACDLIEAEVGRPINFHSYISGVAGPEMAVLFAEEGINGAHQDPQYNVLYRNINMYRSFVDAAEAKRVMVERRHLPDRRRPQRERHRESWLAGAAGADGAARHQLRLLGRLRYAQGPDRPVDRAARRRPGPKAVVRPALRSRPARFLLRLQDARPAEYPLYRSRCRRSRSAPTPSTP